MKYDANIEKKYRILERFIESDELLLRPITQAFVGLLTSGIQHWGKKNTSVLAVQCGSGIFLNTLLHSAFKVSIVEPFDTVRNTIQNEHPRVRVSSTSLSYINVDANSFDYAVVLYPMLYGVPIQPMLEEIIRVTARSILLLGMNMFSLEYCLSKWKNGLGKYMAWSNPFALRSIVQSICPDACITTASAGILPLLWKEKRGIAPYTIVPFPIGGTLSLRIDVPPFIAYSPLLKPVQKSIVKRAVGLQEI